MTAAARRGDGRYAHPVSAATSDPGELDSPGVGDSPPRPEGILARLRRSPATAALLVAVGLCFVASRLHPELVPRFAKVSGRVWAGEWWRLFTASFLHGSVLHLAVNAYALAALGPSVERLYGRAVLLLTFLAGGALGFVASASFVPQPSLGASAGLFALLGLLLAFALRERERLHPLARRAMVRELVTVAALNLALGLAIPFVDNAAHVGGFAGGLALGYALRARRG